MELCETPIHELHRRRLAGEITTAEIAESVLARVQRWEPELNAYITTEDPARVVERAREADARLAKGEDLPPLAGMPLALKDIFCTDGTQTTAGSRLLEGFVPPYDATVVARLKAAGLNAVGKANMDEFAMGSSNENSGYGPVRNPWDRERVPGGSSGGSAAAVAGGEALAALGTDTGGSIRLPCSFCNLVGLKPTYGRVSRYGMVAFASSLDQAGPMTRDVRDAALLLQAIAGHDPADATSSFEAVPDFGAGLEDGLRGKTIGLVKEFQEEGGLTEAVSGSFEQNLAVLRELASDMARM